MMEFDGGLSTLYSMCVIDLIVKCYRNEIGRVISGMLVTHDPLLSFVVSNEAG